MLSQLFLEPWVEAVFAGNEHVTIMRLYGLTWSLILIAASNGAGEEFLRKIDLFQSDAGSTRGVAHCYAIFPCCLAGEIKMIHLVGQLTT